MRKILFVLFIILLVGNVSATSLWVGDERTENISTLSLGQFTEVIEIKGNDAYVKDIFGFEINKNESHQNLTIVLEVQDIPGRNFSVIHPKVLACNIQDSHPTDLISNNYALIPYYEMTCENNNGIDLEEHSSGAMFFELNLSSIPYSKYELTQQSRYIRIQFSYVIPNFVINNIGDYKFILIAPIKSEQVYLNNKLQKNSQIYLIMPSGNPILESKDEMTFEGFTEDGKIVLNAANPKKDYWITYRDANEEKKLRLFRDIAIIAITLAISLFLIPLAERYKQRGTLWRVIFILLSISVFIFGFSGLRDEMSTAIIFGLLSFLFGFILYFDFIFDFTNKTDSYIKSLKKWIKSKHR